MSHAASLAACLLALALSFAASPAALSADFEDMPVPTDEALSLAFSPDGKGVYLGDPYGGIWRWDISTGDVSMRMERALDSITIRNIVRVTSDEAHALIAYGNGEVRYVDLGSGKDIWKVRFFQEQLMSLALSPDGKLGLTSDLSTHVVLFSIADGKVIWDFKHGTMVDDLAFSANGDLVFEAELDSFRAETLEGYLAPFDFDVPGFVHFQDIDVARTGVVAGAAFGEVHLYDGKSGKRMRVVKIDGRLSGKIVAISSDGKRFVTEIANGQAGLFDVKSGKQIGAFGTKGETLSLTAVAFSPDGSRVVAADSDGRISLWKVKGPKQIATARIWPGGYAVFLPDGAFMAEPGSMGGILELNHYDLSQAKPKKVKAAFAK